MTQRRDLYAVGVSVLVLGSLTLSACTASPDYSDLGGEKSAQDTLPQLPPDALSQSVDATSARHVGSFQSADLWLMRNAPHGACLLVYADEEDWYMGCSEQQNQMGVSGGAGEFVVQPDGYPAPEATERISHNVYVAVTGD